MRSSLLLGEQILFELLLLLLLCSCRAPRLLRLLLRLLLLQHLLKIRGNLLPPSRSGRSSGSSHSGRITASSGSSRRGTAPCPCPCLCRRRRSRSGSARAGRRKHPIRPRRRPPLPRHHDRHGHRHGHAVRSWDEDHRTGWAGGGSKPCKLGEVARAGHGLGTRMPRCVRALDAARHSGLDLRLRLQLLVLVLEQLQLLRLDLGLLCLDLRLLRPLLLR
jgi:hypothetical protein